LVAQISWTRPWRSGTERADVVLARAWQDGADRPLVVGQVAEVRKDQVDAEVLVAREREARVDDDYLASAS
jgi:hypothetical protein